MVGIAWTFRISSRSRWTPRQRLAGYLITPIGPIVYLAIGFYYAGDWLHKGCWMLWNTIFYNQTFISKEGRERIKAQRRERRKQKREQKAVIRKLKE
jgi:hypothetical protein